MSAENEKNLLELIQILGREVKHLRQLVHLQMSQIQALRIYSVARIADLSGQERKIAFSEIEKIVREVYDDHISKLSVKLPSIANEIDLRDTLPEQERDLWYLL